MEYTPNYQLPLWDKEDAIKRTDFNENNQKIDAAIKTAEQTAAQAVTGAKQEAANSLAAYKAETDTKLAELSEDRICFGSYVGDGAQTRSIPLPFQPKIAIVFGHHYDGHEKRWLYLFTQDAGCEINSDGCTAVSTWYYLDGDRLVSSHPNWSNYNGIVVPYILIK